MYDRIKNIEASFKGEITGGNMFVNLSILDIGRKKRILFGKIERMPNKYFIQYFMKRHFLNSFRKRQIPIQNLYKVF